MSKLYKYIDNKGNNWAEKYNDALKEDVSVAVFFIGENYDIEKLRIELNYIVSKGYKLFCVINGKPEFDQGLTLQMGLATIINDDENGPDELKDLLLKEDVPKKRKWIPFLVIGLIVVASLIILLYPKTDEVERADNLSLDEVYTEALILAGADSIVVDNGISKEEMLLLESLDLSGLGIENLEPLVYAANLKKLDLSDNNIKDITYIATLTKLEEIDLRNNPIEDYQVLEYMQNLKEIKK